MVSGFVGSLTSTAALAAVARAEGKGALQPVNSTSHWLNGERVARVTRLDGTHTGVGYATHLAATVFWAALLEWWSDRRQSVERLPMMRDAIGVSVIAGFSGHAPVPHSGT